MADTFADIHAGAEHVDNSASRGGESAAAAGPADGAAALKHERNARKKSKRKQRKSRQKEIAAEGRARASGRIPAGAGSSAQSHAGMPPIPPALLAEMARMGITPEQLYKGFEQAMMEEMMMGAAAGGAGGGGGGGYGGPGHYHGHEGHDYDDDDDDDDHYGYGGFSASDIEELVCQGIKPWDDDAHAALAVLHGDFDEDEDEDYY